MRSLVFLSWLLVLPALYAQPAGKRPITTDDYASLAAITEIAVSHDGKFIAYSEARWSKKEDNRRGDLWLATHGSESVTKRLTNERANERHLRWLASGQGLYVLANRKREGEKKPPYDGSTQIWYVGINGDVKPVTNVDGGVESFDYAPEANTLIYNVATSTTDNDDFTALRAKGGIEFGHGTRKTSAVYRVDLVSWRVERIIAEPRYIRELAISRDGRKVAMLTAPDDTVVSSEGSARLDVWDAALGKVIVGDESWRKTAASPYPWLEGLAWAPDGKQVAFCSIFDAYPAEVIVHTQEGSQWTAKRMPRPEGVHVRGYGAALGYVGQQLYYTAEASGYVDLLPMLSADDAKSMKRPEFERVVSLFAFSGDGKTLALVSSRANAMPELFAGSFAAKGALKQITKCNPQADNWLLPTVKHITWKAPDGATVGGALELPPNYKEGTKLPLVVAIHGGPTTSSKTELSFDPHNGRLYFAANGYAVLVPNYRGSTGYGDKFTTDLVGRENDIEVKDILAGIQHLVKEGIADANRVGVMGWSNGGYLTNCLISLKDSPVKIRAASSGAGIVDTVAEWGFNDEPAYPIVFKKGLPWETPDIYKQTSPTYNLGNVKTPTLIHVGGGDERCPPGHSRMLYRALREYNKVPTELLVYTGEPHGLTKLSNRTAKMDWDLAWFKKYLLGQ